MRSTSPVKLILSALAVYRLAYMIAEEDGPANIFLRWRNILLVTLPDPGPDQVHWVTKGFHCVLCLSFWISAVPALLLTRRPVRFLGMWLGIAGGILAIHRMGSDG